MARNSKGGWLLYCMVHIPFFWKLKVGITHALLGAIVRAKAVDRAIDKSLWWWPFPTFVVSIVPPLIIPFGAYRVEQEMHRIMRPFKSDWYKGDGHSEWFNLAPLFFSVPIMLVWNAFYIFLIDACLGTSILPIVAGLFFDALFWVVEFLMRRIA